MFYSLLLANYSGKRYYSYSYDDKELVFITQEIFRKCYAKISIIKKNRDKSCKKVVDLSM